MGRKEQRGRAMKEHPLTAAGRLDAAVDVTRTWRSTYVNAPRRRPFAHTPLGARLASGLSGRSGRSQPTGWALGMDQSMSPIAAGNDGVADDEVHDLRLQK